MIKIDKEKCIGCGMCVALCPEIFKMNDGGKAEVKEQKEISSLKEAIGSCPTDAISE